MKSKLPATATFPKKTYHFWYERMLLMRRFEEKCGQLYGQQKIKGFCHMYNGQEACIVGAVTALKKGDKYITAYRDHAHPIALGVSPEAVMSELFGKETGLVKGRGGSMHMFSKEHHFFGGHGIVGGQIPLGVGIAFAEKYRKTKHLCVTYLGDGAARQGTFHEAANLAMLYKLPVIFAIENNGYAMGTSVERTSNVTDLYQLGSSYEMRSWAVDGMCVEAVHEAMAEAATFARKGEPVLLELKTYRYKGHSVSDPAKYRTREELDAFREKDAIERVKATMLHHKLVSEDWLKKVADTVKAEVEAAVAAAEAAPFPAAETVYDHIYVQPDYPFLPN